MAITSASVFRNLVCRSFFVISNTTPLELQTLLFLIFSKICASKLGVQLIYEWGLYTDVYGIFQYKLYHHQILVSLHLLSRFKDTMDLLGLSFILYVLKLSLGSGFYSWPTQHRVNNYKINSKIYFYYYFFKFVLHDQNKCFNPLYVSIHFTCMSPPWICRCIVF